MELRSAPQRYRVPHYGLRIRNINPLTLMALFFCLALGFSEVRAQPRRVTVVYPSMRRWFHSAMDCA